MRMSRRTARQVGDLNEQIRIAVGGLPLAEAEPRIRVHQGTGATLDECELWGKVGPSVFPKRLCGLPSGIGLRMQLVEKAAQNAGFELPMADLGLRARWHRVRPSGATTDWFELELLVPGR